MEKYEHCQKEFEIGNGVEHETHDSKIKAGDSVLHRPSGETWFVLGVNYKTGKLCVAGWPSTIAEIDDCEIEEMADGQLSEKEIEYRNKEFGGNWE